MKFKVVFIHAIINRTVYYKVNREEWITFCSYRFFWMQIVSWSWRNRIITVEESLFSRVKLFFPFSFCIENLVGTHDAPIRCVEYCPEVNVMVTGSWDQTVKLWDPRTPCNAGTFSQPEKVGS